MISPFSFTNLTISPLWELLCSPNYGGLPLVFFAGRSGNTWQIVNDGKYAPAGGETISRSMSGWLKTGSASAIILLLTSAKKLLTAHENCS
jgi:hypothetical protein